ncbi:hypothetical protein ACSVBT_03960 [Afipia sp. TerB]
MAQTRLIRIIAFAGAITLAAPPAHASDLNLTPPDEPAHNTPLRVDLPNCSRWTDDCVTCTRGQKDEAPVCANIGIACQPKAPRCLDGEKPRGEGK